MSISAHEPTPTEEQNSVDEIVARAERAGDAWATLPLAQRAAVLRAIADGLDAAGDRLVPLAVEETGLGVPRLTGELKRTTFQLRLFADIVEDGSFLDVRVDHADADWPMGAPRPDLRRMLLPIGPVLVFAAGNFPFAFSVAGGDTASALAAGNAVVLKAHPGHPRLSGATGEIVVASAQAAGGPADLLQLVYGTEEGVAVLKHPGIHAAAFTGSTKGGRALFDIAQSRPEPIPFYGELGSTNPVFVLPAAASARPDTIAAEFLASLTGSQGQLCTKPGVLFVPAGSGITDAIAASALPQPARLLDEHIQTGYLGRLEALAQHPGVETLLADDDSHSTPPSPSVLRTGIAPVLEAPDAFITEVFGPAGLVVEYADAGELAMVARGLEGQLTTTVIADDADTEAASSLLPALARKSGRVLWNQWPTGVSVTYAQNHGGPYPATTAPATTSVGTAGIERFLRPVAYQNVPDALLPEPVRESNPLGLPRLVDGHRAS